MSYWKTPSFKALQGLWYQRLKALGFQDIEESVRDSSSLGPTSDGEFRLHRSSDEMVRKRSSFVVASKEAYFTALNQALEIAEFKSETHKFIMTQHAAGALIQEICAQLSHRGPIFLSWKLSRSRSAVRFIIRRYEMKWGLRTYSKKQLNEYF